MADTTNTTTSSASGASSGAGTSAPNPAPAQAQVSVDDLIQIVKFLENLAQMGRLSQLEADGVRPAFERIVTFLRFYEQQMIAAQATATTEVSSEEIDTTSVKSKKKAGKKK